MKIDSHQHFWTIARGDYSWMSPDLGPIYRDFGPEDLAPLIAEAGIDRTILVQAAETVAETEFMLSIADRTEFVAGVVGWIDMEAPDAIPTLERLAENPKFKGIRPMIQDIQDDEWILRPALTPVFDAMIQLGLTFDALTRPRHMKHLLTRLEKHPDLACVIDHASKPALASGDLGEWRADMTRLARETGALCKLSGLVTEAGPDWTIEQLRPVSDLLFEEFGPERVMFGSDWPVLRMASDYPTWVAAAKRLTSKLDNGARKAVWGGTAARFYSVSS